MLGIVLMITKFFGGCINDMIHAIKDEDRRINNRDGYSGMTYLDSRGNVRLVSNNHEAHYTSACPKAPYGDYVLYDWKDGVVVRNFTQEERDEKNRKLMERDMANPLRTTYEVVLPKNSGGGKGSVYKDKVNGNLYQIRVIDKIPYYVDFFSRKIIRKTDYGKKSSVDQFALDIISMDEYINSTSVNLGYDLIGDAVEVYKI